MLIDFQRSGTEDFHCDVCVVGAGAAGIALAMEFASQNARVLVVESGGLDIEPQSQTYLQGETASPVLSDFLGFEEGRARAFGGTTRLWAGQCIRLEPIDFETRKWVPKSGWPLTETQLAPFYDRAEAFMDLRDSRYDRSLWPDVGLDALRTGEHLEPKFTIYTPIPDFKTRFAAQIGRSRNLTALLHATVTDIHLDDARGTVDFIEIGCPNRPRQRVFARQFALCTGGIDSARLLLAANRQVPAGLGNESGLLGRYFQDHPNACTARIVTSDARALQRQFGMVRTRGVRHWPKLALTAEAQRRFEVLNGIANFYYEYEPDSTATLLKNAIDGVRARRLDSTLLRQGACLAARSGELAREFYRWRFKGQAPIFKPSSIHLRAFTEQQPDTENRIELSDQQDALGVPKPRIRWRVSDLELRTLRVVTELVGKEIQRLRLGRMIVEPWLAEGERPPDDAIREQYHHSGATRMSQDARHGVVDTQCRVHGTSNLYVVSSSVFPTSGYANPTLTIIALAMRAAGAMQGALAGRG